MSKELEALYEIKNGTSYVVSNEIVNDYEKEFDILEKELKALEIIKEKTINIVILRCCEILEEYNSIIITKYNGKKHLINEQEFELLKEVLE